MSEPAVQINPGDRVKWNEKILVTTLLHPPEANETSEMLTESYGTVVQEKAEKQCSTLKGQNRSDKFVAVRRDGYVDYICLLEGKLQKATEQ